MRHSAFPQCGMAPLSLKPRAGGPAVLTQLHSPPSIVAQNGDAGSDELNAWIGHAAGGQPMSFLLSDGPVACTSRSHRSQSLHNSCQAAHNQSSPHGKSGGSQHGFVPQAYRIPVMLGRICAPVNGSVPMWTTTSACTHDRVNSEHERQFADQNRTTRLTKHPAGAR